MKLDNAKGILIILILILILIGASVFLVLRSMNKTTTGPLSENDEAEGFSAEIACPLEDDECASSEVSDNLEQAFGYSTLVYNQSATSSSILAVFDGELEIVNFEGGDKIVKIKNEELSAEAEYIFKGAIVKDNGKVSKGEKIGEVIKPEEVEVLNDSLVFYLYSLENGEKRIFRKGELNNLYLD